MEGLLLGGGQRVLDGQLGAGDRLEVVEDQQVARGTQLFGEQGLLRFLAERLEETQVVDLAQELAAEVVHDLLPGPGALVVAVVEDLVDKTGALPPPGEMAEEGGLAGAAHAAQEEDAAPVEEAALDLEDVEVAADETVGGRRLGVAGLDGGVVGGAFFSREVARAQGLGTVLVDDGQQPVLEVDLLVVVGAAALVVVELQAGAAQGGAQRTRRGRAGRRTRPSAAGRR